jgi:hypothetical protein
MEDTVMPNTPPNPRPAPQVNVDPLAELILDLAARVEKLEEDRRITNSLIRTLAGECGYKLKLTKQGGGKVKAEWEKTSGLVTL